MRHLDQLDPVAVPGTEQAEILFWSPDERELGYFAKNELRIVDLSSAVHTLVATFQEIPQRAAGGVWEPGRRIVFTTGFAGLFEVSADGGQPRTLLAPEAPDEIDFHDVSGLPDGAGYLYVLHHRNGINRINVFDGRETRSLIEFPGENIQDPVYSDTGHILFTRSPRNRGIWAVSFSLKELKISGEPFLVAPAAVGPSLASDGTLVFMREETVTTRLAWFDRKGQMLETLEPSWIYTPEFDLSGDDQAILVSARSGDGDDLWMHDLVRHTWTRLTRQQGSELMPAWAPDNQTIVYVTGMTPADFALNVSTVRATQEPRTISEGLCPTFGPNESTLVYTRYNADQTNNTQEDIYRVELTGDSEPERLVASPSRELWPAVSPNGRWVAYSSDESGRFEVYLHALFGGRSKWLVSTRGGFRPKWNVDGTRIYYSEPDGTLMEVDVQPGELPVFGRPGELFRRPPTGVQMPFGWPEAYDFTADEQRFLTLVNPEADSMVNRLVVVQNWFAEFAPAQ